MGAEEVVQIEKVGIFNETLLLLLPSPRHTKCIELPFEEYNTVIINIIMAKSSRSDIP